MSAETESSTPPLVSEQINQPEIGSKIQDTAEQIARISGKLFARTILRSDEATDKKAVHLYENSDALYLNRTFKEMAAEPKGERNYDEHIEGDETINKYVGISKGDSLSMGYDFARIDEPKVKNGVYNDGARDERSLNGNTLRRIGGTSVVTESDNGSKKIRTEMRTSPRKNRKERTTAQPLEDPKRVQYVELVSATEENGQDTHFKQILAYPNDDVGMKTRSIENGEHKFHFIKSKDELSSIRSEAAKVLNTQRAEISKARKLAIERRKA